MHCGTTTLDTDIHVDTSYCIGTAATNINLAFTPIMFIPKATYAEQLPNSFYTRRLLHHPPHRFVLCHVLGSERKGSLTSKSSNTKSAAHRAPCALFRCLSNKGCQNIPSLEVLIPEKDQQKEGGSKRFKLLNCRLMRFLVGWKCNQIVSIAPKLRAVSARVHASSMPCFWWDCCGSFYPWFSNVLLGHSCFYNATLRPTLI